MSFFKNLIKNFSRSENFAERLAEYEQYIYTCKSCHQQMSFDESEPLAMLNCPSCNELFLVPCKLDEWWVTAPLGGGGMGAVYEGHYTGDPELRAAVKVLQTGDNINPLFLGLLIKEAEIGASFGVHPNLAQVYSYGNDGISAYMIMALVEGTRFDHFIDNSKYGAAEELSMYFMLDILGGLEYMFQCGYLYRDLKPENIIVKADGTITLVDYGLCLSTDDAWYNCDDDIMGSPLYMPPERIRGEGEDFRADLYSLGMVMFHCLEGKTYFSQTELMKLIECQSGGLRVQTKFKMKTKIPQLSELIDTLIRINRDERFQSYYDIRLKIHEVLLELHKNKTECKITRRRRAEYIAACQS